MQLDVHNFTQFGKKTLSVFLCFNWFSWFLYGETLKLTLTVAFLVCPWVPGFKFASVRCKGLSDIRDEYSWSP